MVHLLKFGASFLLPPGIFFVIFFYLAVSLFRRNEKKIASMLLVVTSVFYLLSTSVVADSLLRYLEGAYEPPVKPKADVIVMLGAGALKDTPGVTGEGTLTSSATSRFLTTLCLYREMGVPILLSGGQVFADSGEEAKIAQRIFLSLGIPAEKIIIEEKSKNTTQNARYSSEIIKEKGFKNPLLVTSAFHMKRAVLNFEQMGVRVIPYPTDYQVNSIEVFDYTKLRPNSKKFFDSVLVLQELFRTMVTRYLGV